jgi:hypothetical protein
MPKDPTRPSYPVIKQLFALSGNQCAYPKCTTAMVEGDSIIGEICHIRAARPNGPRHDSEQSAVDRHAHDNLILLCGRHHKVVDDDPEAYTVERLLKMKADHARRAASLPADEVDRGARLLTNQSVTSVNQSGGITAHTVNQTFNMLAPVSRANREAERNSMIKRLRQFHDERVEKIASGEAAVELLGNGALIVHLLPFGALDSRQAVSFDEISRNPNMFIPMGGGVRDHKINYEGLLTGSHNDGLSKPQRAYVMVFRSSAVEAVASSLYRGRDERFLILPDIQKMILNGTLLYANALAHFGLESPTAVFVTLVDVQGKELLHQAIEGAFWEDLPSGTLTHDRLAFSECVLDSLPIETEACAKALKPIFDHLANAAGLAASPLFDTAGNYTGS